MFHASLHPGNRVVGARETVAARVLVDEFCLFLLIVEMFVAENGSGSGFFFADVRYSALR